MFKRIATTFGTRFITAVINFLVVVAVSQFLGPAGKGEQGIIITTIALILLFSNMVGGASLVYLAPRYRLRQLMGPAYVWSVITGLVWWAVLYSTQLVPREWAFHIALLSVINSWASVNSNVLIGRERIGHSNLVNLLQSMTVIIVFTGVVLLSDVRDIRAYIVALYASYLCMLLISLIFVSSVKKSPQQLPVSPYSRIVRELFYYGFMNQLAHIAQLLSFRLSYYLLEGYSGLASVGVYSNGVSLMEAVWMISGSIALVQYSTISNTTDRVYAQQLTARFIRISLWASLAVILPLVLLPSGFYTFLFGAGFSDINLILWWLAPGILVYNIALIGGHYFSGTGKYYVNALASAAGLVVTLALGFWLIPQYGGPGAAITATLSYFLTSAVVALWFCKESGLPFSTLLPSVADLREIAGSLSARLQSFKNGHHGKNQ